jgi:hypothetical protein
MYNIQICPTNVSTDSHYETHQQESSTCSFRDEKYVRTYRGTLPVPQFNILKYNT